jgi:hypothetical protein
MSFFILKDVVQFRNYAFYINVQNQLQAKDSEELEARPPKSTNCPPNHKIASRKPVQENLQEVHDPKQGSNNQNLRHSKI